MVSNFKDKVKKVIIIIQGDAVMYFNNNLGGRGYNFNDEEHKKAMDYKNIFKH